MIEEPNSTVELLTQWKKMYSEGALMSFTFEQVTVRFKENIPVDTSLWQEAISFPDQFRIDFGSKEDGNRNLWRNDSVYVLRNHKIVNHAKEIQQFLLIEGGIYYVEVDQIIKKLEEVGLNTDLFRITQHNGRKTYVIGAKENDKNSPQIWLDAEYRAAVHRVMKMPNDQVIHVYYDQFEKIDGFWTETYLEFYLEGSLLQTEKYQNIIMNPKLSKDIFSPQGMVNNYWY